MAIGGDPVKVIRAALIANGAIATIKFIASYLSESTATLAEAVHSVADTGNQALLLVGVKLAVKKDEKRFAFGRAAERYFWPFIVALMLFSVGGAFALYEGIHKLVAHEQAPEVEFFSLRGPVVPIAVLGISVVFESYSCWVALREFRKTVGRASLRKALFDGKDPTIPLVLMEDIAALLGLALALVAVVLSRVTGNAVFDAIGSIVIGVLLCLIATVIAFDAHSLIIGERATPEMEREVQEIAAATPGVRAVTQLLTYHVGPEYVVLALKVAFEPTATLAEVETTTDELERRVRAKIPIMQQIFVEPDSDGDLRGVARPEVPAPA